jgi:basic amino acid/polyamine antiporter, APA family
MIDLTASALKPRLTLFDSLSIVAGSTIGSGIFIVSAGIAREVQSPALLLLVWIAASLMCHWRAHGCRARRADAGGRRTIRFPARVLRRDVRIGWTIVAVVHTGSIAAVSIAFAKYLAVLVPAIHSKLREVQDLGHEARADSLNLV